MAKFSELGIKADTLVFKGDKIKPKRLLGKDITIHHFRIEKSNYDEGNGMRLKMQITYNGESNIMFTGSVHLQDMIQKVKESDFPLETKIIQEEEGGRYLFT